MLLLSVRQLAVEARVFLSEERIQAFSEDERCPGGLAQPQQSLFVRSARRLRFI
jgi:hypothetical protein